MLEHCFLFQGKGSLIDSVMILGGQKEDVRFNDEGFAYTFGLTYFAYMWLKLTEMPCKAAASSATLAVSVTAGITGQITTHTCHCFAESGRLCYLSLVKNSKGFSVNLFLKIRMTIALFQS